MLERGIFKALDMIRMSSSFAFPSIGGECKWAFICLSESIDIFDWEDFGTTVISIMQL